MGLRFRAAACVLASAVLFVPSGVRAEEWSPQDATAANPPPADPWAHRPLSLLWRAELGGGEFGPTGLQALAVELTPVRWFSLTGGAGFSLDGTQLAAVARVRLFVTSRTAIAIGAGPSSGKYVDTNEPWLDLCLFDCTSYHKRVWDAALWGNAELSIEGRTGGGFEWRFFGGVQSLLDPNDGVCVSTIPCPVTGGIEGYAGTELGYAFGAWN